MFGSNREEQMYKEQLGMQQNQIQQRQSYQDQSELYNQQGDDSDYQAHLLKITLDMGNQIKDIENFLRRRVLVTDEITGKLKYNNLGKPALNDSGIQHLLLVVSGYINRSTVMAYISAKEKEKISYAVAIDVLEILIMNEKEYEVQWNMASHLPRQLGDQVGLVLSRAIDRSEAKDIYGRHKAIDHTMLGDTRITMPKKSFGVFGGNN